MGSQDKRGEQGQTQAQVPDLLEEETFSGAIRSVWHDGRQFFSVVDVIGVLTESSTPRRYWTDMKRRLAEVEGFREVSAKCVQLKMEAPDGKQRLTDAADAETMLRIIQSIPSPKAEPLKQWLARTGAERLQEMEHPELAADRMRHEYLARGYSEEWVNARMQGIVVRDELTAEWRERGAEKGREFAILTDILHRGTFDVSTAEHKAIKKLKQRHQLRDSMTTLELALTILAKATPTELHQAHDSQGFGQLQGDAHAAASVAGNARREIEAQTGRPVVSAENFKSLTERPGLRSSQQIPPAAPARPDEE